jgi:TusA-related sulfurtransferase
MAKYNTALESYYQGAHQIDSFIKNEIGTLEESNNIMKMARKASKNLVRHMSEVEKFSSPTAKKLNEMYINAHLRAKVDHHKMNKDFQQYAKKLHGLFATENEKGEIVAKNVSVGEQTLDELISSNSHAMTTHFFENPKLKWKSESGANAMKKFSELLLGNDEKKLRYCKDCVSKTKQTIDLRNVLDCPTPVTKKAEIEDVTKLANRIKELEKKLSATEGIFHKNSPEYKEMKAAMQSVKQGLISGLEADEFGSRLEALQAASMKYAKAKGVGTQISQRGIDRMDAALDLCALAADGMEFYASKERRAELEQFENDNFNKVVTKQIQSEEVFLQEAGEIFEEAKEKLIDEIDVLFEEEPSVELDF